MNKTYKKWVITYLVVLVIVLAAVGTVVAVVDPYFHYHKPLSNISYILSKERYQNDGIAKHFDYDAVLVGTSMASNYKTSDIDRLFGTHSAKLTFLGGSARELHDTLDTVFEYNPNVKMVFRSVDYLGLLNTADKMGYTSSLFPLYLYDKNPLNDVEYLLNKAVLEDVYKDLQRTRAGFPTTTFDDYSNWANDSEFGKDVLDSTYNRAEKVPQDNEFSEEDQQIVSENIQKNYIDQINAHPGVDFYIFFPPFSMYYFDSLYQSGDLERYLAAERYTMNMLLECDNVHLYSYLQETDAAENLEMYKDMSHFVAEYNTEILEMIAAGKNEITKDNVNDYYQFMEEFYGNYDYDSLFE